MARLYYRVGKERYEILNALMSFPTVEKFFNLYGEEKILDITAEKIGTYDIHKNCYEVDEE